MSIYPSVASNILNIDAPAAAGQVYSFSIVDVLGRAQIAPVQGADGHFTIDVSRLTAGTYLLQISAGGTKQTARFIKN